LQNGGVHIASVSCHHGSAIMEKEIEYRLFGLESIIHGLHHNLELMEYMSYGLHKERFNLFNNLRLIWIWRSLRANQIIDFYKNIAKNEKF
jgi:hypothetical protein